MDLAVKVKDLELREGKGVLVAKLENGKEIIVDRVVPASHVYATFNRPRMEGNVIRYEKIEDIHVNCEYGGAGRIDVFDCSLDLETGEMSRQLKEEQKNPLVRSFSY